MDYSVIDRYIDRLMADTTPDKPIWNIENIINFRISHKNNPDRIFLSGRQKVVLYFLLFHQGYQYPKSHKCAFFSELIGFFMLIHHLCYIIKIKKPIL